jgi:hypothetical protein
MIDLAAARNRRFALSGILLAAFLAFAPRPAAAIDFQAGGGFVVAVPRGELGENIENTGLGLELHGGIWLGASPVMLGAQLGFLNYGSESRREPFSLTIPDVEVEVTTTNSIYSGHLMLRLAPRLPGVRPYAEGVVGFKNFETTTKIEEIDGDPDEDPIAESTNLGDTVFSYGGSAGLMFRVWRSGLGSDAPDGMLGEDFDVWLDLRFGYQGGGEAEYLKEGAITRGPDGVEYDISRSSTELMLFQVGAAVTF